MSNDPSSSDRPGAVEPSLDWTVFDDQTRSGIVERLDRTAFARSATLQRVVDLAATFAQSGFAQISLLGEAQYVPVARGTLPLLDGTPIPDSLCSITMASGQSVVIGDTSRHSWVRDLPLVAAGAVGSYLGVPLRNSDGVVLGALCVYNKHSTVWPNHLASALEDLLAFAATEIQQIATIDSQEASLEQLTTAIQNIVAPPPVAVPPGVQLAGRYRSADVGGDWYEWTPTAHDEIALTIGDVSGHGLDAVAKMTRLKAHVHAYLLEGHGPAETLRLANQSFEDSGQMATVLDARYRPADKLMTFASAGHPPPLIVRGDVAFFASVQPGPPLGFAIRTPLTQSLTLEVGDTVLLCTDGLYETLDEFVDQLLRIPLSDTNDDACVLALRV